jgi:hypothetical protein
VVGDAPTTTRWGGPHQGTGSGYPTAPAPQGANGRDAVWVSGVTKLKGPAMLPNHCQSLRRLAWSILGEPTEGFMVEG